MFTLSDGIRSLVCSMPTLSGMWGPITFTPPPLWGVVRMLQFAQNQQLAVHFIIMIIATESVVSWGGGGNPTDLLLGNAASGTLLLPRYRLPEPRFAPAGSARPRHTLLAARRRGGRDLGPRYQEFRSRYRKVRSRYQKVRVRTTFG